jgi:hypothetical protein
MNKEGGSLSNTLKASFGSRLWRWLLPGLHPSEREMLVYLLEKRRSGGTLSPLLQRELEYLLNVQAAGTIMFPLNESAFAWKSRT